jgi:MFS family permease
MSELMMTARVESERLDPRRWAALAVLLVGAFLAPLDFFIVNVALPSITLGLGASAADVQLVISGYAVWSMRSFSSLAGGSATYSDASPCRRWRRPPWRRRLWLPSMPCFPLASAGAR